MKRTQRGFTLIEIVVVLAILAMAVLLVLPRLPDTGEASLKASARRLAATLRYARDQSAVSRLPHRIRFFPGTGKIAITLLPAGGTEQTPDDPFLQRELLSDGIKVIDIQSPRFGKVTHGEMSIDLGPAGVPEVTVIHLRESGGKQMTLTAFPFGGKIRIEEGYREVIP